jgi:cholesterol transport system auxiliary component
MMALKGAAGAMIGALLLSGCAFSSLMSGGAAPLTYDLHAPEPVSSARVRRSLHLAINAPIAVRTIDTEEILVRTPDGKLAYFPGAVWGDRLPRLVQARLVELFSNSGAFRAVVTQQDRVAGEVSLTLEIRAFQIDVLNGNAEASIDVFAKLVDERNGAVIATKRFAERAPAVKDDVDSGVKALNDAFHSVATNLLNWTARARGQA